MCVTSLCWLIVVYLLQSRVQVTHKAICGAQNQQNSTVCLSHSPVSTVPLYLPFNPSSISFCWLSPRHPSIHLPSFNDSLCFPPHCLLFLPLMSQSQIWGSLIPHSLGHCGLVWRGVIRGWEDGGKASEWRALVFSEAAGGCKMQKQRRTSRLKKTCMNASEKAVVLPACLIPVTPSQPCLSGHYCWVYFCYLLSLLRIKQLTANICTWGVGVLWPWTWHCPRNACAVIRADKSCTLDSTQESCGGPYMGFSGTVTKMYFSCNKTP